MLSTLKTMNIPIAKIDNLYQITFDNFSYIYLAYIII